MNRFRNAVGMMLFGVTPLLSFAQQPPTPPDPPFVNALPSVAAWTVTYTEQQVKPETSPVNKPQTLSSIPVEVKIAKFDQKYRAIVVWNTGQTSEMWRVGPYSLSEQPNSPDIYIVDQRRSSQSGQVVKDSTISTDFPELIWLSIKSYRNEASFKGKKCRLFSSENGAAQSPGQTENPPKAAVSEGSERNIFKQAWIDVETKLPCAVAEGNILKTYTFQGSDFPRPMMPERFVKALKAYEAKADQSKYLMKVK